MIRQFAGTKFDFMEPKLTKPCWKNWTGIWLRGFPAIRVNKEGHFFRGLGIRIFGAP